MKRDRGKGQSSSTPSMASAAKGKKMWEEDNGGGMDELLAVLGYKVKASDMADVAEKLEQLAMVMDQEDGISLLSESVHYNPSDLSGWVQSMLSELNAGGQSQQPSSALVDSSSSHLISTGDNFPQPRIYEDNSEYDLSAIPGGALCKQKQKQSPVLLQQNQTNKRIKIEGSDGPVLLPPEIIPPGSSASRPVVLVDSQETGVRLVHTLIACADAIQQENLKLADALVKHIGLLAAAQAGAMKKVATYFAEALARRIYNFHPQDLNCSDLLEMHFYETCPYLKFAHFTANQAILEAFEGESRVHVVDFGLKQGMQWPALMQALALRPGGPPKFRLTGVGPPQADNSDALQGVGWKLAQLAETIGVEFEFRGFVVTSLADLDAEILDIRPREVESVAVNSVFELHRLLARPGSIEKVLDSVKRMKPKIVTVVEQEANHNGSVFVDRFNEALHYYSTMFDSLEGSGLAQTVNSQDVVMSEVYLGRQICNVVACEGGDRVERHETLNQWRARMGAAGFESAHLGSNAFRQASMLLALFGGGDWYRVEENDGCLTLGWHTRPLIATSAWQLAAAES